MKHMYFSLILLASIAAGAQIHAMTGAVRRGAGQAARAAGEYLSKESGALKQEAKVLGEQAEALGKQAEVLAQEAAVAGRQAQTAARAAEGAMGRGSMVRGIGQPSEAMQGGLMSRMGGQTREFSTSRPAQGLREIYEWATGEAAEREAKERQETREREQKKQDEIERIREQYDQDIKEMERRERESDVTELWGVFREERGVLNKLRDESKNLEEYREARNRLLKPIREKYPKIQKKVERERENERNYIAAESQQNDFLTLIIARQLELMGDQLEGRGKAGEIRDIINLGHETAEEIKNLLYKFGKKGPEHFDEKAYFQELKRVWQTYDQKYNGYIRNKN